MAERSIEVLVDEALTKENKSYLRVEIHVNGVPKVVMGVSRNAGPGDISRSLNETGYLIKNGEYIELSEEERQRLGDLHIEASYVVPGLGKK